MSRNKRLIQETPFEKRIAIVVQALLEVLGDDLANLEKDVADLKRRVSVLEDPHSRFD